VLPYHMYVDKIRQVSADLVLVHSLYILCSALGENNTRTHQEMR